MGCQSSMSATVRGGGLATDASGPLHSSLCQPETRRGSPILTHPVPPPLGSSAPQRAEVELLGVGVLEPRPSGGELAVAAALLARDGLEPRRTVDARYLGLDVDALGGGPPEGELVGGHA